MSRRAWRPTARRARRCSTIRDRGITLIGIFTNLHDDGAIHLALPIDGWHGSSIDATLDTVRTIRGIPTEVPLGTDEGLPTECVAAFDATTVFPRAMLVRRVGALSPPPGSTSLCDALAAATDC